MKGIWRSVRDGSWITTERVRIYPRLVLAAYVAVGTAWILSSHAAVGRYGTAIGADFVAMWTASAMTLSGFPAALYNQARMLAAQRAAFGPHLALCAFFYPPTYLLMILPLARLPYLWSLLAWTTATSLAYLAVMRQITRNPIGIWLTVAFPGAMVNLTNGQNGFLTLALFGGGLLAIETRPILAGVFFGLLCYKPQFGLVLPIFLLMARQWRTIASTTVTVAIMIVLSMAAFGPQTWEAFLAAMSFARHVVLEHGGNGFAKLQSTFATARMWNLSIELSYAMQTIVGALALAGAVLVWMRTGILPLRAAALITATLLITPYVFDYDFVLLALPIAWLSLEALRTEFLPFEKSILALAWMLPMVSRSLNAMLMLPLSPIILMLLLWIIVRRSVRDTASIEADPCREVPLRAQLSA